MAQKKFVFVVTLIAACFVYLLTTQLHNQVDNKGHLPFAIKSNKVSRDLETQALERTTDSIRFKEDNVRHHRATREPTQLKNVNDQKDRLKNFIMKSETEARFYPEVTHINFLKVHKAASTTVQNIMMRFGLKRNLSFVIPASNHYISKTKTYFSDLWPPLPKENTLFSDIKNCCDVEKYDILCNHMVFNSKKVARLLHNDSVYIGIVREPLDQFLSAAFYYKFKWKYPYLVRLPNDTFITDLIRNPRQKEATTTFESMTYNSMAYDFGLGFGTVEEAAKISPRKFDEFLNATAKRFNLVMIFEKFDESLVMLKRYLNWTLDDILYAKNNAFKLDVRHNTSEMFEITANDTTIFKKRNRFDYGLYKFFKVRLDEQISREELFYEEVNRFKEIQREVHKFCEEEIDKQEGTQSDLLKDYSNLQKMKAKGALKNITATNNTSEDQTRELIKVINSTLNNYVMTKDQALELRHLAKMNTQIQDLYNWPIKDLTKILPLLFYRKVRHDKEFDRGHSYHLVSQSQWNKQFFVSSTDCELMNMNELSLFGEVKKQHLKLLVRRKFGDDFSVIEAVKYIFTFV